MHANQSHSDILQRLVAYKAANQIDVAYYRRVIRESPERALDMLLHKDMQRHEAAMRAIVKQIPQAQAFYDHQSADVKKRIDQRCLNSHPYYKDRTFVGEVKREIARLGRMKQ